MASRDGFSWTEEDGLKPGVPCIGAIQPPSNLTSAHDVTYDVIVAGAGYCGLTAARDAAVAGLKMQDELEVSYDFSRGINEYHISNGRTTQRFTHDEEDKIVESGLRKLVNVDGAYGKNVIPFSHTGKFSSEAIRLDSMSVADRLAEIQDSLTPNERLAVESFVLLCSGGTLETTSFFEFLHCFAIRFFQEALATGNLTYAFNSPIATVRNTIAGVEVITRQARRFKARRMISAIPLKVLNNVAFDPPLPQGKQAAASIGHVNQCVKVHAEVRDRDLRSYTGISYPHNGLFYALGDGETPTGNTHIVAFGGQHNHFEPDEDIEATKKALQGLTPMNIERIVFHNWSKDEFAKGAWFFPGPGLLSNHLNDMRACHGKVFFASSDWALGWRSFIDGAIEEGTRAALAVRNDLGRGEHVRMRSKLA
ncbi:monoamine oxidase N [Colletotrichum nymphaeae SA-01]|uniref:monoamine oxidase n=1 Tax=Colletotrichum nymphaeae SA-01 TaxID=1460502 RepID=A0A135SXH6_9PEZI|nr:monoamine oxidase N [Colletotrichum nymphaeae SA-01]